MAILDCTFWYNSSIDINGTFTSPNYPGFAPVNVQCDYLFYGNPAKKETVEINFETFDVGTRYVPYMDVIKPCGSVVAQRF